MSALGIHVFLEDVTINSLTLYRPIEAVGMQGRQLVTIYECHFQIKCDEASQMSEDVCHWTGKTF